MVRPAAISWLAVIAFSSAAFSSAGSATGSLTTSKSMCGTFIIDSAPRSRAMYSGDSRYTPCSCFARNVSAAGWMSGPTS